MLFLACLGVACSKLNEKQEGKYDVASTRNAFDIKHYIVDFNKDGLTDTLLFLNFLYGPGVKQGGALAVQATENVNQHDSSFYVLSDIYLIHNKRRFLLLALEKDELHMTFPPFQPDSFVVKPLNNTQGIRIENISPEQIPEITYIDVIINSKEVKVQTLGRIKISKGNYSEKYYGDTCFATVNARFRDGKRISFSRLESDIDFEQWTCNFLH